MTDATMPAQQPTPTPNNEVKKGALVRAARPPSSANGLSATTSSSSRSSSASHRRNRRGNTPPKVNRPPGDFEGEYHPRRRGRSTERRSPLERQRWRRVAALSPPRQREARPPPPRQGYVVRFLPVVDDARFDPRDLTGAVGPETDHILEASSLRFVTAMPEKEVVDRIHNAVPWAIRVCSNTKTSSRPEVNVR